MSGKHTESSTSTQLINEVSSTVDTTETTTEYSNFISDSSEATSTSTQLINEVNVDTTETTTENSIFNIILEASNEPIEAPAAEALNSNAAGVFSSENTQHNDRFVDDTELARLWIEMKKEEKEHLKSTMQEINGEVSFRFGQNQHSTERPILGYNDTAEPNLPLPGLTDHTASSGRTLGFAGIVVGLLVGGIAVGVAAVGTAYCMWKRSKQGQYDVEKAVKPNPAEVRSLLTQPGIKDTTSSIEQSQRL